MDERHRIEAAGVAAEIAAHGAELVGLKGADGGELVWQAGPEWPRHAPILFPIVGRLASDTLRHEGAAYPLAQHGFARDSRFEWVERGASRAVLRLSDSEATRARFPFAFRLEQTYRVEGARLGVTTRVENPGGTPLPFGVGAHPAFRWPLVDGVPKTRHRIVFDAPERPVSRIVAGGLLAGERPLPLDGGGRILPLDEALFAADALVMPGIASRGLSYEALDEEGAPARALRFAFGNYPDLGLWSKPTGAAFLCVEPWASMASPVGFDGAFVEKPGILHLSPGESSAFTWSVAV